MKGRKPKPTQLKAVTGNPGGKALNKNEPEPDGDLIAAPDWMSDDQKASWTYAIENAPLGLLKNLDQSILTIWVIAEDYHRQAVKKIAGDLVITAEESGYKMQNPYLSIVNKQAEIMMKSSAEMGFTPSSRSRVSMGGSPKKGNRFSGNGQR